jgi:tmRNA-binding protein
LYLFLPKNAPRFNCLGAFVKMKTNPLLIIFLISLFFASCKRQKTPDAPVVSSAKAKIDSALAKSQDSPRMDTVISKTSPVRTPQGAESEDEIIKVDEIDFKYLKMKSKAVVKNDNGDTQDYAIQVRMKKDSIIWLSVSWSLFGEVGRLVFKKDSAYTLVTNKKTLGKDYKVFGYEAFSEEYGVKLNYDIVQSLIIGNQPLKKKYKVSKEKGFFLLRQNEGKVEIDNYINEDNRKLKKLMLTQQSAHKKLTMDFEDFNTLNSFLFPYSSLITLDYQGEDMKFYQTSVQLKHTKVELVEEALEFPFKYK